MLPLFSHANVNIIVESQLLGTLCLILRYFYHHIISMMASWWIICVML